NNNLLGLNENPPLLIHLYGFPQISSIANPLLIDCLKSKYAQ
ncbi:2619_t:CDS:1, partial [Entrophospora sp. SA101]